MTKMKFFATVWLLSLPLLVQASGFGLYEQGVTAQGNAGAYVSRAEDPSAVYYNPAGLAQLAFSELSFNANTLFTKSYYSNGGQSTWDSDTETTPYPTLFANFKAGRFGFGLGYANTFDWDLTWPEADFPGRYQSSGSSWNVQELMAGFGFKLTDSFSFGVTGRFARAEQTYSRVLPRPFAASDDTLFYETDQTFTTEGDDIGFIFGLQYYPSRRFNIGVAYHTPIEIDMDGDVSFTQLTRLNDARATGDFESRFAAGPITSSLELPSRMQVGAASRVTVRTRLEVDVSYEDWTSIDQTLYSDGVTTTVIPRNWEDVYTLRLAGDFQQRKALNWRIGLASTLGTVIPDETVEPGFADFERFTYSFGVSYLWRKKYTFEANWMYVQNRDRITEGLEYIYNPNDPNFYTSNGQQGNHETQRHFINFGVRVRLGVKAQKGL